MASARILLKFSLFLVTGVLCLNPAMADADSDHRLLSELGVYGEWAENCALPAGKDNAHLFFLPPSRGRAPAKALKLPGKVIFYEIRKVRKLSNQRVRWIETRNGAPYVDLVVIVRDNRMRGVQSVGRDGTVYIEDGYMKLIRKPSPWLTKCTPGLSAML